MTKELIYEADFESAENWIVESNGSLDVSDGELKWDCEGGSVRGTIWCKQRFEGPLMVEYDVQSLAGRDNLNLILYGRTENDDLLETTDERTGDYPEYHEFPNYIMTHVTDGDGRNRVRFRKDPGFNLLDEMFEESRIEQGVTFHMESIVKEDGTMTLKRNGDELLTCKDDDTLPLSGYIGLRTWNTRLVYSDFKVYSI